MPILQYAVSAGVSASCAQAHAAQQPVQPMQVFPPPLCPNQATHLRASMRSRVLRLNSCSIMIRGAASDEDEPGTTRRPDDLVGP